MVDPRPVEHDGRPYLLLRDPLQLSDRSLLVPQPLVAVLGLLDGARETIEEVVAAFETRFGLPIDPGVIEALLHALDEALLLDNDRFARARQLALEEYLRGPSRRSALAGSSYPGDPSELASLLQHYLDDAGETSGNGSERGLMSPHIDYARGGTVYAKTWARSAASARAADLVVIFGTNHYGAEHRLTLTRQSYGTPFGVLPTPREKIDRLIEAIGERAGTSGEIFHLAEHSIELAAVWLQYVRQGEPVETIPILCGSFADFIESGTSPESDSTLSALLEALETVCKGRRVLVVAAADLAHVGPAFGGEPVTEAGRAALLKADTELIDRMSAGDAVGFFNSISRVKDSNNVCGVSAIYLALRMLGRVDGEPIAYDNCPADREGTSLVSVCGVLFR